MTNKNIGFVGVGRMGANMARRLNSLGFSITALYDVNRAAAEELAMDLGTFTCSSLAEVTAAAEVIFTVVPDDAAQLSIFAEPTAGGDTLLTSDAQGKIFINCATLSPSTHREVEQRAEEAGAQTLEACMASSINQALEGTLYLMCSGKKAVFDSVQEVLLPLSDGGKLLSYIGETGQAAQLKALVNMVMNINTAGLAEGLGLAAALRLDLQTVMKVFSQTGANSRVLATDGEDMVNRDHACFFSAAHAAKDSGIALQLAKEQGLDLPLAAATKAQYDKLAALGFGQLDKSAIAELTFPGRGKA